MSEFEPKHNRKQSDQLIRPAKLDRTMSRLEHDENPHLTQQQALGNQAMQRFAQSCPLALPSPSLCPFGGVCHICPARVQPKLKINQPNDKYEQEANRVADEVLRMLNPTISERSQSDGVPPAPYIQRQCPECEEELQRQPEEEEKEKLLQAKKMPGKTPNVNFRIDASINSVLSGGQPLPESMRDYFELRFGYDFSQVRVHTDARATELARTMNARAFTFGRNIVFGQGQFLAHTNSGRRLLAHELTHVVQQKNINSDQSGRVRSFKAHQSPDTPVIQFQRFRDCTPAITGTKGGLTQTQIDNTIHFARQQASIMVTHAVKAVRGVKAGTCSAEIGAIFLSHFGDPDVKQIDTIINRFTKIQKRLPKDDLFICNSAKSYICKEKDVPAYNVCGMKYPTHLCPLFFKILDAPGTIIHEAAHAAGACINDVYPDGEYPPSNAHGNAPSYEYFATEVWQNVPMSKPTSGPPRRERPRPPSLIEAIIRSQDRRMGERILESVPE